MMLFPHWGLSFMIEPINFLVPLALLGLIVLAALFFASRTR